MQLLGHHSVSYACLPAALPKSIGQLVALVTLDVSNNRITCKPAKPMLYTGSVCLTPHLCMFPTAVPDSMGQLHSLRDLYVDGDVLKGEPGRVLGAASDVRTSRNVCVAHRPARIA